MKRSAIIKMWAFFIVCFLAIAFVPTPTFAETDITDKIELQKSRLMYDRRTGTSYFDVSIKNISDIILPTPIKVVIEIISSPDVTVGNYDGLTDEGKPYFEYNTDLGGILQGEESSSKKWQFDNPNRRRFTYSYSVQGIIPEAAAVIGPEGGVVEVNDLTSLLYGLKMVIPGFALNEKYVIIVQKNDNLPEPPFYVKDTSTAFRLLPDNLQFNNEKIVQVTIPYNFNTTIPQDFIFAMRYSNGKEKWVDVDRLSINKAMDILTIGINHFSDYQVMNANVDLTQSIDIGFLFYKDRFPIHQGAGGDVTTCKGVSVYTTWYYYEKGHGLRCAYNNTRAIQVKDKAHQKLANNYWWGGAQADDYVVKRLWLGLNNYHKPQLLGMRAGWGNQHMVMCNRTRRIRTKLQRVGNTLLRGFRNKGLFYQFPDFLFFLKAQMV